MILVEEYVVFKTISRTGGKKVCLPKTLFSFILRTLMEIQIWKRSIFTIANKDYVTYICIFFQNRIVLKL